MAEWTALLAAALAAAPPRRCLRATDRTLPSGPGDLTVTPHVRLIVGISGTRRILVRRDGGTAPWAVTPRDALLVAPHCPILSDAARPYRTLGIVFADQGLRLLCSSAGRRGSGRAVFERHGPLGTQLQADLQRALRAEDEREACFIVGLVLMQCAALLARPSPSGDRPSRSYLAALRFLEEHCGEDVGRADVARLLGVHPNHVSRLFARHGGGSLSDALLEARLRRAQTLLAQPGGSIATIARHCGFAYSNYFIRCFRLRFGTTPARWRAARAAQGGSAGSTPS